MAEVLIKYGIDGGDFVFRKVESASNASYTEKYYEIPEEIAKFGILVVSNNNGAVENITLVYQNQLIWKKRRREQIILIGKQTRKCIFLL